MQLGFDNPQISNFKLTFVNGLEQLAHQSVTRPFTRSQTQVVAVPKDIFHVGQLRGRKRRLLILLLGGSLLLLHFIHLVIGHTAGPCMTQACNLDTRVCQPVHTSDEGSLNLILGVNKEAKVRKVRQTQRKKLVHNLHVKVEIRRQLFEDSTGSCRGRHSVTVKGGARNHKKSRIEADSFEELVICLLQNNHRTSDMYVDEKLPTAEKRVDTRTHDSLQLLFWQWR